MCDKVKREKWKKNAFMRSDVLDGDDEHHDEDGRYVSFFLSRFKYSNKLVTEKVKSIKLLVQP